MGAHQYRWHNAIHIVLCYKRLQNIARLVTLDLRDGSTVWEQEHRGNLENLQALGGTTVVFDGTAHGLG